MTLITYIISSILLSLFGMGVYLAFRWTRPTPGARRAMIWLVVGVSLILPLTLPIHDSAANTPVVAAHQHVEAPAMASTTGGTINDFCHCADPHAGDVIMYQASKAYDILLVNRGVLLVIFLGMMGIVLFRLLFRTFLLWRLTRRHAAEYTTVQGEKVRLVRGIARLAAGSLRLGGKYIFWHDDLDKLDEKAREAILLHELSHIRQRNTYEKLALGLLQSIWLINPALYFFGRELELLSEFTADRYAARATGDRKAYAMLLLQIKSGRFAMPVHFFRGSKVKTRIARILTDEPSPRVHFFPAFVLGLLLLFPGEVITQNLIREQLRDIEVYEFLTRKNQETGEREFCKKCAYEAVNHCYFE